MIIVAIIAVAATMIATITDVFDCLPICLVPVVPCGVLQHLMGPVDRQEKGLRLATVIIGPGWLVRREAIAEKR